MCWHWLSRDHQAQVWMWPRNTRFTSQLFETSVSVPGSYSHFYSCLTLHTLCLCDTQESVCDCFSFFLSRRLLASDNNTAWDSLASASQPVYLMIQNSCTVTMTTSWLLIQNEALPEIKSTKILNFMSKLCQLSGAVVQVYPHTITMKKANCQLWICHWCECDRLSFVGILTCPGHYLLYYRRNGERWRIGGWIVRKTIWYRPQMGEKIKLGSHTVSQLFADFLYFLFSTCFKGRVTWSQLSRCGTKTTLVWDSVVQCAISMHWCSPWVISLSSREQQQLDTSNQRRSISCFSLCDVLFRTTTFIPGINVAVNLATYCCLFLAHGGQFGESFWKKRKKK